MTNLPAFLVLITLLTITPGADTMLLFRNTLRGGVGAGLATAGGGRLGLLLHATASALGLSVVLAESAGAYDAVKLAGAVYLIWLGIQSLRSAIRGSPAHSEDAEPEKPGHPFREGFLTNLLNPKTAVFYLAILPQFVDPTGSVLSQSLLLAGAHVLISLAWYGVLAALIGRTRRLLVGGRVRRWLDGSSGAILIALGGLLVLQRR